MRAPLPTSFRAQRLQSRVIAAVSALLLSGCGDGAPTDTLNDNATVDGKVPVALEWRAGDENSFIAHRFDHEVIRCWNVQGKYDCLVAQSMDLKNIIPGAPGRLAFFRFRAEALPATQDDIDALASSDGYACELTSLPGKAVMTESYWTSGRMVHDHASPLDDGGLWTMADVERFQVEGKVREVRPFFACSAVIAPVLDVGLYALDSGLIGYDQIFSAVDYPGPREAATPEPEASET